MIFKTFQSDLDGINNKLGFNKRSFAEWGKQVSASFKESEGVLNSFKNALKTAFSAPENKEVNWIKNSVGDIVSKENIDSFIPKLTIEGSIKLTKQIKEQSIAVANGSKSWDNYFSVLKQHNQGYIVDLIKNTNDLSKLTSEDLVKANQQARASALAHNEAIKAQTLSAKAGAVALKALSIAGNMIAMWAISKGLELAVKGIDELAHSAEHCKERVDSLMSSYQSALSEANANAQTVEDLASRYETLSKGVNNLGENVSLTTDEYTEYNKIANQITDMFPNLIQGYTNEGNAILSLKGNVEELRDAYRDAQQEAYNMLLVSGKDSDGTDIIKNFQNTFNANPFGFDFSTPKEYIDDITLLYNAMFDSDEEYNKLYNMLMAKLNIPQYRNVKKVLKDIGFTSDLSSADRQNIANNVKSYIQTYQTEIDSALKNVQTLANAYLMTNEDYAKLDEQAKNAASIIVNSINENIASGFGSKEDVGSYVANIVDMIKDNPEVHDALIGLFSLDTSSLTPQQAKELADQYIGCIAEALGEDKLELKIRLDFEDTDTIARNYNTVMHNAAAKFSGVNVYQGNSGETPDNVTGNEHTVLSTEAKEAFINERAALEAFAEGNSINTQDEIAFWNQCIEESETKEEAMEKYLAAKITDFEDDILLPTLSSSISTLASQLESQFTKLGEAYNAIFTADGFTLDTVDNSLLESLRKSFAETGEEIGVTFDAEQLEPFFATLTNRSSTADDVQQAFNDLASAYLYSTSTLEQLNDETASAIEKQLAEIGVANAHEVVLNALSEAKIRAVLAGYDLSGASSETMAAILNEGQAAGITAEMVYTLTAAEIAYGDNDLSIIEKINSLKVLAQAYGDVTTAALAASVAKDMSGKAAVDPESALAGLMNSFGRYKVDIDFSPVEKSASSAAKQAETDWKNILDRETDLLEKQLAANVITFKEYTDKRRQIIEDYYRNSKISAEEYYDALESMYDHQLSLYDRVVNAVTDRIDDEIDRLKDQKEEIEKSYQVKIDAIQEEIDALNKANEARKAQIDLEKAQYEAERARNQRVNKVYDGSQFIYAADMEAVRDAEDDLADREFRLNISRLETQIESLKGEMENATKSLDNQIDALEAYKDKWNEISDVYQKQQDKLLAAEVMGTEWERDILNGRLDTLRSFTEQYIALQQAQADAAVNAAKIKAEAEAGNATGGSVGSVNTDSNDSNVNKNGNGSLLGQAFETIANTISKGIAGTTKTVLTSIKETPITVKKSRGIAGDDLYYAKKYASGTDNARKGLNLVGEDGTETFIDNDGNVALVTQPTLIPMEGGEIVRNAEETKAMLDVGNIEPVQGKEMRAVFARIRNMQPSDFNWQSFMQQPLSTMVNIPYMDYSHMLNNTSAEHNVVHIDNLSINCPNVTNNSGAEYLIKTLERLPLDNLQHMHRRKR